MVETGREFWMCFQVAPACCHSAPFNLDGFLFSKDSFSEIMRKHRKASFVSSGVSTPVALCLEKFWMVSAVPQFQHFQQVEEKK